MKSKSILKIKSLHIKNFKSIVDLTINEPNPFTVFVGPNGSGKSNIFEALEFMSLTSSKYNSAISLFGGEQSFIPQNVIHLLNEKHLHFSSLEFDENNVYTLGRITGKPYDVAYYGISLIKGSHGQFVQHPFFITNFSKIFPNSKKENKQNFTDDKKLNTNTNNLEKVLKRLLENKEKREEISEWLELFLPEFDRIEVQKAQYSSSEDLLIYQKHYERPFNKELISDGTYNIIALLTAVYQSDEPQFLCIEEPENGLNPYVIRKLVDFFRNACAEKGHYIWLNTHSQTLVECLQPEEVIVVDKINGETQIKQIKGMNLHGLDMAEVWLSGALGGGTPW